jgi:hypothetical protein
MSGKDVFYGCAIQGAVDRSARADLNSVLIEQIRSLGFVVAYDHTTGKSKDEAARLFNAADGSKIPSGEQRTIYVRRKMIEKIEGEIAAAIFEVSVPSLGTGIELTHAYLRPKMGLKGIPILALYQTAFWPNNLSSMIRGIAPEELPNFQLREYRNAEEAKQHIQSFLKDLFP